MFSRYWGILFAAIGLALISYGLGAYHVSLNQPDEQRQQPYRAAADDIPNIDPTLPRAANSKPPEYREPCRDPKGKDESDLCAQWRAAKAGENSAFWAKWSFWTGWLGFVGLILTLYYTRKAVLAAENATSDTEKMMAIARNSAAATMRSADSAAEQVRLSREALVSTERAYVSMTGLISARTVFAPNMLVAVKFSVQWSDTGNTPANNTVTRVNMTLRDNPIPDDFDFADTEQADHKMRSGIGPKSHTTSGSCHITNQEINRMINGRIFIYMWGWFEYDDVFPDTKRHRTEFAFQLAVDQFSIGDTLQFRDITLHRHNGMDGDCIRNPVSAKGPTHRLGQEKT